MRGSPDLQMTMLTTVSTEAMVPADHPLRRIRTIVDAVLAEMDGDFEAMFSIRSERAFCQHLTYNLLFKWFLDLPIDAPAFDPTTFTKNRERLLQAEIADRFLAEVVKQAKLRRYISSEHFSVDGTLLEAWASHKSFRPATRTARLRRRSPVEAGMPSATSTASAGPTRPTARPPTRRPG